jgi:hypothetical protein
MSLEVKNLASGLLPQASGTPPDEMTRIYLAPRNGIESAAASKAAVLKTIRLVNSHDEAVAMKLWFVPYTPSDPYDEDAGNPNRRPIFPKTMSLEPGQMLIEEAELTLSPGDAIWGSASHAEGGWPTEEPSGIEYVISGAEREVV